MRVPFERMSDLRNFLFLGRAFVVVISKVTKRHFTFRISSASKNPDLHFVWVKVINNKFLYLGVIYKCHFFRLTSRSKFNDKSPQYIAFKYLLGVVTHKSYIPPKLEVCHTGRCGRCGAWLSAPESLSRGYGPECYRKIGIQGA